MKPHELAEDRVIIIDKPPGLTSHEVTTYVKKIIGANRSGHAGTLDPEVSGVLPVAIGRATKLLRYIAGKDKTYVGIIKFKVPQTKEGIVRLFAEFVGEITQTPPKISAVRKVARKRTVYYLKLLETGGQVAASHKPAGLHGNPAHRNRPAISIASSSAGAEGRMPETGDGMPVTWRVALFETKVDAGTYIRTLCEDIGEKCGGARMEELRRTAVGNITEKEAHGMYGLVDAVWLMKSKNDDTELRKMLAEPQKLIGLKKAWVKESALKNILSGAQVMVPAVEKIGDVKKGERVAVYSGSLFVGVGVMQIAGEDFQHKKKGPAVKMERVHLPKKEG
ncbi:MAG: PUA domain-containing protein [Candidatus Micrarchaeota archaeon]